MCVVSVGTTEFIRIDIRPALNCILILYEKYYIAKYAPPTSRWKKAWHLFLGLDWAQHTTFFYVGPCQIPPGLEGRGYASPPAWSLENAAVSYRCCVAASWRQSRIQSTSYSLSSFTSVTVCSTESFGIDSSAR